MQATGQRAKRISRPNRTKGKNMSDLVTPQNLRLPSLSITGFRGVEQLTITKLGRVTLLAGKNGAGKTTVLDAVQIFAARGQHDALQELLVRREEFTSGYDEDGDLVNAPSTDALFHGRGSGTQAIAIGPVSGDANLEIGLSSREYLREDQRSLFDNLVPENGDAPILRVSFRDTEKFLPIVLSPNNLASKHTLSLLLKRRLGSQDRNIPPVRCELLGPGLISNRDLARFWDSVALTEDESFALDALKLVFGEKVRRVTLIGDETEFRAGRRVVVKLSDQRRPVPLKSLGDGATRLFGVALALANCRDGILLLDEAENGIHHSLQTGFWNMVLRAASTNNTQVLATTHSKDCINGFAWAALKCPDTDGNLIRLERENGEVRAVEYSKEELETAAEQDIEVR